VISKGNRHPASRHRSAATWRQAQMVPLSPQRVPVAKIAEVTLISPDRLRNVLHNFERTAWTRSIRATSGGRLPELNLPQPPADQEARAGPSTRSRPAVLLLDCVPSGPTRCRPTKGPTTLLTRPCEPQIGPAGDR